MKWRHRVLGGYAAWVALLVVVYYWLPSLRTEAWGLIGLTGIAGVVTGVIVHRPSRRGPWLLVAVALTSFAAGQVSFLVAAMEGTALPFPSFADVLYLLTFPLFAVAMSIFIWWRTPDRDRRSLIDALTLTAGLALLSWMYLISPYVHNPQLSWLQKCVAIAYPLGDVLILAMVARLLAPSSRRSRSVQLLTLGAVGVLVSDVLYGLIQLHGSFHNGTAIDLGWAVFYGAWGAAALHPSMAELTQPVKRLQVEVWPGRLAVLMLASLIAPVVLFVEPPGRKAADGGVIAVFSAVLFLLVLSRLWDVAVSHRRALGRERAVRQAGVALVSAITVDDVAAAVRSATDTLLSRAPRHDMLFAVRTDGALRVVAPAPDNTAPDSADAARLGELAQAWLPRLTGPGALLAPAAREPGQAGDWLLLCPLTAENQPSGDAFVGVLGVLGEQRVLADLAATIEIVAHQAGAAVERIRLRAEIIRQGSEAYFRALVQDTSDVILIVGDDGTVRYATPSAASIFGDITIAGASIEELVAESDRDQLAQLFASLRTNPSLGTVFTDRELTRRDGGHVRVLTKASDLRDDPAVAGLVITLRDVTEQRQLEEQLKYQAFHDALTGLPNRLLFQDRVSQQMTAAQQHGWTAGVLFVDLDDFKVINDTMGHGVGDDLLVAAAIRLSGLIRPADAAARLSGDEFALLIGDVADSAAVELAAERVIRAFSEPFALQAGAVVATVTVGVATTEDSADTGELLRHADLALYAAKAAGKRQWRRYQPVLSAGLNRRREMQSALEEAVARSAFTLAYQPIVALGSGELAGFEALVRWPHAQWGMIQPDQFIALAEETGQIVALGSWVLARAASDIAQWRRDRSSASAQPKTPDRLYISVNVSARQFSAPGFVDGVRRILEKSGLEPGALMLELTESVLLRRDDRVHDDLLELKEIGVRLAIDDFGTGYSSLSYLRELPIDVLKMDKSFVDGIAVSEQRLALAEGIVRIARTLRLDVIAEGIESEVQRDLLTSMGCQFGQGYLLAMPMEAGPAERLARTGARLIPRLPRSLPEGGASGPGSAGPGISGAAAPEPTLPRRAT